MAKQVVHGRRGAKRRVTHGVNRRLRQRDIFKGHDDVSLDELPPMNKRVRAVKSQERKPEQLLLRKSTIWITEREDTRDCSFCSHLYH